MRRIILAAIVVGAVLVSATAASASRHHARIRLAVVPLQTAQLGPAGASLALNYGSGSISNDGSGFVSIVASIPASARSGSASHGPLGGYALDYGDPYTGSAGVTEIRSSVEEYRTRPDARKALRSYRLLDQFEKIFLGSPAAPVTLKRVKPFPVGQARFGYLITRAAPNLNPLVMLDEQVAAGRFVLDLTVTAGSATAAERVAPHLLRKLHRRLQLMLGGHLSTVKPPKLPPEPTSGQAPGGPDLSTLILQPTDVGQSHAVNLFQGYDAGPPALSDFLMILQPAGTYDELVQQIGWWPTATEATYGETYGGGNPFSLLFAILGGAATPVDLSAVGDGATGYLINDSGQSEALVTLTNGQAGESIFASSNSTLQASDVQSLAQAAANRLDAGLP